MSIDFNITTPDMAYGFLLDTLGFQPGELIMEYLVDCGRDIDLFCERNIHRLGGLNIHEVHFIAFHITGSLDDCQEIKEHGIRNLQYVLSRDTTLSRLLGCCDIHFNIENKIMLINGTEFNIDYDYYRNLRPDTSEEKSLESVAHRIYYDFCVDGFLSSDDVEGYGTDIHKRPEFLSKMIKLSPKAKSLETFWRSNSKPYKVLFYATADQIHKFTFNLEKNYEPYTEYEQEEIKRWMLRKSIDRAFDPCDDCYIYIRDNEHIPPEQIIRCEILSSKEKA